MQIDYFNSLKSFLHKMKKKNLLIFLSLLFFVTSTYAVCFLFFVFVFMLSATSHITLHLWEWVKWQSKSKLANKRPDQRAAYAWLFQFWASTKCSFSRVYLQEQIHLYSFCNFFMSVSVFFFCAQVVMFLWMRPVNMWNLLTLEQASDVRAFFRITSQEAQNLSCPQR